MPASVVPEAHERRHADRDGDARRENLLYFRHTAAAFAFCCSPVQWCSPFIFQFAFEKKVQQQVRNLDRIHKYHA